MNVIPETRQTGNPMKVIPETRQTGYIRDLSFYLNF
jgi:hypothetical protein